MFIALSFVGSLPSYIVDCVKQIRIYFAGDVYLIFNDTKSDYIQQLEQYQIKLIDYQQVYSEPFNQVIRNSGHKIQYITGLIGREELFMRSLERFFLLDNLMKKYKLIEGLFMEIDNLIYDDPNKWLAKLEKPLAYMFDNWDRYASGIMFVKDYNSLDKLLAHTLDFISNSNKFINEMTVLYEYYELNKDEIELLPTYWHNQYIPVLAHINFGKYGESIFDSAGIGIYLLGLDPIHTGGVIKTGQRGRWSAIDYTVCKFEWKEDIMGKRPYVWTGNKWLLINNLHVHSKNLSAGLSK